MFKNAESIWLKNKRTTKNLQVGFRCDFIADENKTYKLKITGATLYRIFLNGNFVGYGPARAGHGYVRVDETKLKVSSGLNKLAIEVAGYNCASFYTLPIKSFLCAEIYENDEVIKHTGRDFNCISLEKLRNMKAYRYSYQRAYTEVWNFENSSELTNWKTSDNLCYDVVYSFRIEEEFIPRMLPLPDYNIISAQSIIEKGVISHKDFEIRDVRYVNSVSNTTDGFLADEITEKTLCELYGDFMPEFTGMGTAVSSHIGNNEYVIYKLPFNNTGFLRNCIKAVKDSRVYVFFAEHNYGNGLIFESPSQINLVKYNLKKSDEIYTTETFEAYCCQYIGIAVVDGEIEVDIPQMREYCYPKTSNTVFDVKCDDLKLIFDAAKETFRQNTLDVYMDCPSRERGGWLCDSYFTAYSEKLFAGESMVEKAFLENFIMAKEFPNIPQGMLPMVYPSHTNVYEDMFIPQWGLWYVVELGEFCTKRTSENPEPYRELCYNLLGWCKKYENPDGLLERMPGWNFVEWSKANDWVWDVNYPTNMLYSKMLSVMGELFGDDELSQKSKKVKETVIKQSFDGVYFRDNAVRDDKGKLKVTGNCSETCQYYAYFFGVADARDKRFEELTDKLLNVFGPERKSRGELPKIEYANAFIGNYLRIIILLRMGEFKRVISDIKNYFLKMAKTTGTLWENDDLEKSKKEGSLNHGFASFAGVALIFALCGIRSIDFCNKQVLIDEKFISGIDFSVELKTCDGSLTVSESGGFKKTEVPFEWKKINLDL